MMRTILLFIVLSNHCFCQIQKHKTSLNYPEITNSILPGDWYLKETNLIPANWNGKLPRGSTLTLPMLVCTCFAV